MRTRSRFHFGLWVFLIVFLSGCTKQPTTAPMPEVGVSPTVPVHPTSTSVPRWVMYEKALSSAINHTEDGLCEWDLLGYSGNEVYVYALCQVRGPHRTSGSGPAVLHLDENGEIKRVTIPRDGNVYNDDIRAMFPAELHKVIFDPGYMGPHAEEHIDERMKSNGPPLIEIYATPLP